MDFSFILKLRSRVPMCMVFLFICLFAGVADIMAQKPVWQQSDPNGEYYLKGRRALAGDGCEVNMLVSTVNVGSWATGLGNLVDEDLTNVATFPSGVSLDVGVAPVVSIRDMKNHYAAGTKAGFVIASAEGSLLSLDVVKAYAIQFYCDGEKVGDPVPVEEGQNAGALGLSLIKIPGSEDVTTTLAAKAPGDFDEVCLMPAGGVKLELISNTRVKYAFVGEAKQYYLANTATDGIDDYNKDFGTNLVLEAHASDVANKKDLIDNDLTNGVNFATVVLGGGNVNVRAMPADYDQTKDDNVPPFKAGTVFGFRCSNITDILKIGGKSIRLLLGRHKTGGLWYDTWSDYITVEGNILGVSLSGSEGGNIEICADKDCYGVELSEFKIGAGGMTVNYAYIRTPDEVNHRCDIRLSADANICDSETSYKVTKSGNVDVTYEITKQPEGANAVIDSEGNITGMTANGDYVVTATSKEDCHCTSTVTIHRGMGDVEVDVIDKPLYNIPGDENYILSYDTHNITGGALINLDDLSDEGNILNPQIGDYAQYTGGLGLAENVLITGVRTSDRKPLKDKMPDKKLKRVGFMVETRSTGLGLDALKFFCIRGFKNGVEVFNKPVEESNAVNLGLIGSSKAEKMRYSVVVPVEYEDIDEFQLWKEGVLNLTISKLNIFYAFAAEEDKADAPLAGVKVVSVDDGASLDVDRMNHVGVVSIANVTMPLTNLIDNDPDFETPLMIANTVSAGGGIYAVKLGRTYKKSTQVGFVLDEKTYTASIGAGKWVKMTTYLNGVEQEHQQDWNVLGVSVIGAGDKRLVVMQPQTDFDEVGIEFSAVLDVLDYIKVYGVFVRPDSDGDGVPDNIDENSCEEELILNEEVQDDLAKGRDYSKARLLLHRTFNRGTVIGDNLWSSIVLPVDLTGLQVRNAFGNDTRLAEVKGMEGDMLVFKRIDVPANDDNPVIKAGVFYIIETVRTPDYTKTAGDGWDKFSDGTGYNSGDVYYIDGVSYDHNGNETEPTNTYSNDAGSHSVTFHSTYNYEQALPKDIYAFSSGKLWLITNSAKMKGFRFWITETFGSSSEAKQMPFKVIDGNGETTYISSLSAEGLPLPSGKVYDMAGRNVGTADDLPVLPAGVYVMDGRKLVVK